MLILNLALLYPEPVIHQIRAQAARPTRSSIQVIILCKLIISKYHVTIKKN